MLKGLLEMRYLPSDKYTIAWFKLAECVARGERERALGVYRLLVHSFDDPAFARQLEGDIVLAFDDKPVAIERYREAAALYVSTSRLLEAAAVYEHVLALSPDKQEYLSILAHLYTDLSMPSKAIAHLHALIALAIGIHDMQAALAALDHMSRLSAPQDMVGIRQQVVYALISSDYPHDLIVSHIHHLIDGLLLECEQKNLQQFLAYLQGQSEELYKKARFHLENKA
ncbi:MAG TPA: hypothetical protein VLH77_04165 [Gammaproteobacteria bacterium]|nr:hypothetical protein [Gammaproteobacteria bacterium]